jgi:putative ABC transport system permease protein
MTARLYRLALRLLPPGVRAQHADAMAAVFDELVREAMRRRGRRAVPRVLVAELVALCRFARGARQGEPRPRRLDERALVPVRPGQGGRPMMASLLQDVRFGARLLRRAPGFTLVGVGTLALAMGATTAIFTVLHGVVLKALPYVDPARVVIIGHRTAGFDGLSSTSPGNLYDWMRGATVLEAIAGFAPTERIVTVDGQAERLRGSLSVGSVFEVLGRRPAEGRTLTAADDAPGAEPVVVLSTRLARRLFGGASSLGRSIAINTVPHTVVGVMPPDFAFFDFNDEYWIPARFDAGFRQNRDQFFLLAVARLPQGVAQSQAQAQLDTLMDAIRRDHPQYTQNAVAAIVPMKQVLLDGAERRLSVLMGAVVFVLLIACANLGNLLLARAATRRREMAVRHALGAGHGRLVRQTVVESLVLAVLGGAAGLAVGAGLVRILLALLPPDLPRLSGVGLDGPVLVFAAVLTLATAVFFGAFPVLSLARRLPAADLRDGTRTTGRAGWARQALVTAQLAFALMLLVGAGLLTRSFAALLDVPPGFAADRLLTFTASVSTAVYRDVPGRAAFFERAAVALEALPGVQSVTLSTTLPVAGRGNGAWFNVLARPLPPDQTPPAVPNRVVRANYFEALGIPVRRGRGFTADDGRDGRNVVVISESVARRFFADADAIGQRIYMGASDNRVVPESEIVGVVADVKQRGLDEDQPEAVYAPHALIPGIAGFTFAIRTAGDPAALAPAVRDVMRRLDPGVPLIRVQTMDDILRRTTAPARSSMVLVTVFAAVALTLALIGVFGVLSYAVSQQTAEFGIRMALGASARDVRRQVLNQGVGPVGAGIACGLAGALALARTMDSLLFGVTATDPATLAAVAGLLAATALAAAYVPARRATEVDPVQVLRQS